MAVRNRFNSNFLCCRGLRCVAFGLALVAAAPLAARETPDFILIANPLRPESSLTREEASRIFLRKQRAWRSGDEAHPIDQGAGSDIHDWFCRTVHQRPPEALLQFWDQQVIYGRGWPPQTAQSDAEVVEYVARTPGAIGYVHASARLAGVKPLTLVD